jgi:Sulfotransferase domain
MSGGSDVVLHVGYGKTATTWLQEKVFGALGEDCYLGKREGNFPRWLLRLNYLDDFAFWSQRQQLREEIGAAIGSRRRAIISSEAFTNFNAIYQQIERIRVMFDHPRIVLVLRDPIVWLISNYRYCVEYERFDRPLESYLDFGVDRTPYALEKRPPFYIPDFYYSEIVAHYRSVFGQASVCVLRYEDFVADPGSFGLELSRFIGVPLVDFAQKAQEKVLAGMDGPSLERKRCENMIGYLRAGGFRADGIAPIGAQSDFLSEAARLRLAAQLAPYCGEYYPEYRRCAP